MNKKQTSELTPEVIQANVAKLSAEMGIDQIEQEHLITSGVQNFNQAMVNMVKAGLCFLAYERIPRIENLRSPDIRISEIKGIKATLEEMGVSYQRAHEAMQLAKFVSGLAAPERKKMMNIGKSKALLLSALPPESVEDILSNPEQTDEVDCMSVRELKTRVKDLRLRNEQLADEAAYAKNTLDLIKQKGDPLVHCTSPDGVSEQAIIDRKHSLTAFHMVNQAIATLTSILNRQSNDVDFGTSINAATSTLVAIEGLVINTCKSFELEASQGAAEIDPPLSQMECDRIAHEIKLATDMYKHRLVLASDEASHEAKRGRGRPRKVVQD